MIPCWNARKGAMEHYDCSPPHQKSEDGQSSSWNSGSSAGATLEGMDVNRIMEDNIPLSYLYSPNIQGLLWDPSSLSHAVVPPLSSGDQRNEKREAPSYLPLVSNKRSYVPDNIYEALQQTTIPSVPQQDPADADDEATACPIVPVIDFFSNGVFFYDSGNAPVQEEAPYPSAPHYGFGISVVPHEEEDYSSDEEVVYSDEGDLQPTERGNVKCRTL